MLDEVSVLFNEPKLLKLREFAGIDLPAGFSALQRAEIAETISTATWSTTCAGFSALQRAEIAEISERRRCAARSTQVSVLFNEPKLLKSKGDKKWQSKFGSFSALQRAEIAEIKRFLALMDEIGRRFSALQRAEIAEMCRKHDENRQLARFSALQRAEIAEIQLPSVSTL